MTRKNTLRSSILAAFAKPVETDRLILKHWTRTAPETLMNYFNADNRAWMGYMKWFAEEDYDAGRSAYISRYITRWALKNDSVTIGMFLKQSQCLIGELVLQNSAAGHQRLAYFVLPSERRKGLASEAYAGTAANAFNKAAFRANYAEVVNDNVASHAILLKNGFTVAGTGPFTSPGYENQQALIFKRSLS